MRFSILWQLTWKVRCSPQWTHNLTRTYVELPSPLNLVISIFMHIFDRWKKICTKVIQKLITLSLLSSSFEVHRIATVKLYGNFV